MAESGLTSMATAEPTATPATMVDAAGQMRACVTRCVLIAPSLHTPAWLVALEAAAGTLGWDVVIVNLNDEIIISRPTETLAVVFEAESTYRLAIDQFAIISTGLASSPEAAVNLFGASQARSFVNASSILALGHALPKSFTRRFSDSDLLAGTRIFEAFDGIMITVPELEPVKLDSARRRLAQDVLGFLEQRPFTAGAAMEWPRELFIYHSGSDGNEAVGRIDVTGRPRRLVLGPYVWLPPGRWEAEVRFAVDKDTARHHFRVEWGDMTSYTVTPFEPQQPGRYSLSSTHQWKYPNFSELQVAISESSLGGDFFFEGVRVELTEPVL